MLVRVHAAGLNHLDLFVLGGLPGISYNFPHIVGSDAAGTIAALGPAAAAWGWAVGDRVMMNPGIGCNSASAAWPTSSRSARATASSASTRRARRRSTWWCPCGTWPGCPDGMNWATAAAFSLVTLTAWRMLTNRARLRAGETVLIWGIGGGVAQACVQITRLLGGTSIVTSSSDAKLERARALGADHLVNHAREDVPTAVRALTRGRNADVVVDTVGEETWGRSLRSLGRGGRLVTCGGTSGPMVTTDVRKLFWYQWDILGSTMGGDREYQEVARHAYEGRLWPVVDSIVALPEGAAAFRRMADGAQFGKLVIEVAP